MIWIVLSDTVVALHFGFIAFVMLGGLAALRWRWVLWVHLPAVAWAILVEASNWTCPLTPLEKTLREWGGGGAYSGDFVANYALPVLYAGAWSRGLQIVAAMVVAGVNLAAYVWIFKIRGRKRLG